MALMNKESKYKAKLTQAANSSVLNDSEFITLAIFFMIQIAVLSVFNLPCLKFDEAKAPGAKL